MMRYNDSLNLAREVYNRRSEDTVAFITIFCFYQSHVQASSDSEVSHKSSASSWQAFAGSVMCAQYTKRSELERAARQIQNPGEL